MRAPSTRVGVDEYNVGLQPLVNLEAVTDQELDDLLGVGVLDLDGEGADVDEVEGDRLKDGQLCALNVKAEVVHRRVV